MVEQAQAAKLPIQGLVDIPGDALVFGQGQRADFAYDGETVYLWDAHRNQAKAYSY